MACEGWETHMTKISGTHTVAVTLSSQIPSVVITGTVNAEGQFSTYAGQALYGAIFGPAGTAFTLRNKGVIESTGTSAADAGIVLGSPGTIVNTGGLRAGSGIDIFGAAGASVTNKNQIIATLGNGVYLQSAGTVENAGLIKAAQTAILLAGGGYAYNKGTLIGATGMVIKGSATSYAYNNGTIMAKQGDGISLTAAGYVYNAGYLQAKTDGIALAGGGFAYNLGLIHAGQVGISAAGGAVYNDQRGNITASLYGISMGGTGYVYNAGTIRIKANAGSFGAGLMFSDGGYFYNTAGGEVKGGAGVLVRGAAGTIVNFGNVDGAGSLGAVTLTAGGTITNFGTIKGGTSYSGANEAILVEGAAGTVVNNGFLTSDGYGGVVVLKAGGTLLNTGEIYPMSALAVTIAGPGYVFNSGLIYGYIDLGGLGSLKNTGTVAGDVLLKAGGNITNQGHLGEATLGGFGTVINSGSVTGEGIDLANGGTVINNGTAYAHGDPMAFYRYAGVSLNQGGLLLNTGNIGGFSYGVKLRSGGTVINTGTIYGTKFEQQNFATGVDSESGGTVLNYGFISATSGIVLNGGGTILNAGTIQATAPGSFAVYMTKGFANRLIEVPGAILEGPVYGGGGVLELLAGSVSGNVFYGSRFSGFDQITVDQGAAWAFDHTALPASVALDNAGTLLAPTGAILTIASTITGDGTIAFGAAGLALDGSVAAGQHIAFGGTAETLDIGNAPGFAGAVQNFAAGDTIDLTGIAKNLVDNITFSHGVLTISEAFAAYNITFANPASFAGDRFKVFKDHAGTGITLQGTAKMAFISPPAPPPAMPDLSGSAVPAASVPGAAAQTTVAVTGAWAPRWPETATPPLPPFTLQS
jgi:hypothetical protein